MLNLGWCLDLYILDDCTMHDGSSICEMLAMTLERVHRKSVETGQPFPRTVLLASDNTVREAKNSIVLLMLANLCAQYKCRVTGLINLRKAHTHDKLDQPLVANNYCFLFGAKFIFLSFSFAGVSKHDNIRLWGIIARRIAAASNLQSPEDVIETMKSELARPAMKSWIGLNTQVNAMKLDVVRSWKSHFSTPQQVGLSGGLRDDSTSNHCFVFMLRKGWRVESWIVGGICCCKNIT